MLNPTLLGKLSIFWEARDYNSGLSTWGGHYGLFPDEKKGDQWTVWSPVLKLQNPQDEESLPFNWKEIFVDELLSSTDPRFGSVFP